MASNTEILIKRSLVNSAPANLHQGELAFSYASNTLFIGTSDSNSAFEIAGYRDYSANYVSGAGQYGNTTTIPVITVASNGQITAVNTAVISTTLGINADIGGPSSVDLLNQTLDIAGGEGITSSIADQTITLDVDDTVVRSNTNMVMQVIDGDIQISGNLTVLGNTTQIDVQTLNVADPLIYLASNNYTSDLVDIGFVGNYFDGSTQRHTGVFRHANDKQYYVFDNYDEEPTANTIDPTNPSFNLATLNANLTAPQVNVSSQLYVSGQGQFDDTTVRFTAGTNVRFEDGSHINFGPNSYTRYYNQDNNDYIELRNNGTESNSNFVFYDSQIDADVLGIQTSNVTSARTLSLYGSMDIRDDVSGESVLNKGEQKFGVVTHVVMDGIGGATFKTITDPDIPPPVSSMSRVDLGTDYDDAFTEVTLPWNFDFNGTSYGSVFVGSNGYLTFGSGSSSNGNYFPAHANHPGQPGIVVASGDISYQRVYTYDNGSSFRIRYEGNHVFGGQHIDGSSDIIWEVVFYQGTSEFTVRVVKLSGSPANNNLRWASYLTDDSNFIGDFSNGNPTDKSFPIYTQTGSQLVNQEAELSIRSDGYLYTDALRNDNTLPDVVFYNPTTKEVTYGTVNSLTPSQIANGAYAMTISGDDGLVVAPAKIIAAQSSGTTNGGFSFSGNEGGADTGMFSSSDGLLSFYSNDQEYFRIDQNTGYNYTYVPLQLRNGAVLDDSNNDAIVLGRNANLSNYPQSIAIGYATNAGGNQLWQSIALGAYAGNTNQGGSAIAIGARAGYNSQSDNGIAIGRNSGNYQQSSYAIAMGWYAGNNQQSTAAVAIGEEAGRYNQNSETVAIGSWAGREYQGWKSVAIGSSAGNYYQGDWSVAVGLNAGRISQGHSSVAMGHVAGWEQQGDDSVAIGVGAGKNYQGNYAVAIGERAGYGNDGIQGNYAIAIGARAGYNQQYEHSIILNASGDNLDTASSGLFIDPIAYEETQDATYDGLMFYNSNTKEVRYSYTLDGGVF